MDEQDKLEIEKIIRDRKITAGYMMKNSPVFNAFTALEAKTFTDGALSRNKELIAIGISIVINCNSISRYD
ncbi:MAG TPA: hypothetical protein PKK43_12770 [Spirochaetota bacterium]|nr:hypothetical protein [Spirochaetota bacterium]